MTVTAKAKTKFSSRNLNAVYKAPLSKAADNAGYHSGSRMLVLRSSNSMGGRSSILAAKSLAVAVPAPINTPSLRKENNGQDVHVNLVPTGKVGWGTSPRANEHKNNTNVEEPEPRAAGHTGTEHSTAHFSSRSESSHQVWGGRLASSSQRQGESAQHHSDWNSRAAFSMQSGPNRGRLFSGASSTGRWGDDAVEQDIARSDMMRAVQKERDFPQLKENYANDAHHSHASGDQRFSDNNNSTSTSYGREQRHRRYDSYEFERRGGGNSFHEDRFSSRGYGGFDRTRGPPPNSYGNNSHSYYHPSDSRYDNYERASPHQSIASSSYHHQHPGSDDRFYDSYRREHSHPNGHPSDGYYGEDHHDAGRFQGRPYQIERRGCDTMSEPHRSNAMPFRSDTDNQSSASGLDNQKSVPWSLSEPVVQQQQQQLLSNRNAPRGNASVSRIPESQIKDDRGNDKGATPQAVSASVWKKVDADIAQNCSSGARPQASEHLPPMKSPSIHQPFAGGRPFSVRGDMSTSSSLYRPSQVVTPAQSNPTVAPVRILKRDGPKMLFDPKTGTTVNAEEKPPNRNQRLPSAAAAASSSSTVASSETETGGSSRDSVPAAELKPNTESSAGGVAKRTSHAKPAQIWKRSSSEEKALVSLKPENEETEPAPETTVPSKSIEPQAPVQQLSSKLLRGKKAKGSDSSTSKKAVVKSKTKKYVLAYRPVSKPASDEAAATPVDAESAPAPLPMKKFNELFAPSKPITLAEEPAEPATSRAVESTTVKHLKKQSVPSKFPKTVKSAHRRNEIANEDCVRKSNSKALNVFRKRLESLASSEGSSTHSSNNSADTLRIAIELPPSTASGREDTPRVRHSKIRKGIDVDILKQIPEGGGVVVLTDAQEGIEFLPDDSENKFETVRSRRAVLLEKKQLREASAAVVQKRTPRTKRTHGVKQQIIASGIVMAAPSRTAKRTLVVGTRANAGKAATGLPKSSTSEFRPNRSPVKAKAEFSESPPVFSAVQAAKSEQPKGNLRNRASSLPNHAQKPPAEHYKTQSDQPSTTKANASAKAKQNLKTHVKKRVYRELPPKKEDVDPVKGNEVLTHSSSNPIGATAAAGDCRPNGELKTRDASTHARKQGRKLVKSQKVNNTLQSTPVEMKIVEELTETTGVHKEPTVASARPVRLDSDLSKSSKQSAARKVKNQRSSAAVAPVKMKYVPKVPVKAASTGESAKPEVPKPEVIRLPEEVAIVTSAKTVDGGERRNSRKVNQTLKLSAAKAAPLATAPADPVPKTKPTQHKSVSSANRKVRAATPTPDKIEAAPAAAQSQSRSTKDYEEVPRKVSKTTTSKTPNGDVNPKPVERPAPLKKRLSKSRADLPTPLSAAKSYKQIYVVKSSSSTSSPTPSSSAA